MAEQLKQQILTHLKSDAYRPQKPRKLARALDLAGEEEYNAFRTALRDLMHAGRVVLGAGGAVVLPGQGGGPREEFVGTYRQNRRGFGFVVPTDPTSKEDLFIPEGENAGALTGDIVRARITNREHREGKIMYRGRITEILQRSQNRFVGTLARQNREWVVLPDGNTMTQPIFCPDAAARHIKPGTKVVVELTQFPSDNHPPVGVISEILGKAGEKDVDLKSVIVQFNLPADFPDEVKDQARHAVATFDPEKERQNRLDLTGQVIVTIDPPDAKDYDDAISLRHLPTGEWELGVHIADVAHFVPEGSPLDEEARQRGNSCYFPGFVIPMLPEVLSNGVCSLQEGVPRLCKSAFITYDQKAMPVGTKFANSVIQSSQRLRYIEAQAIIDGADEIPHPDGSRKVSDYPPEVVKLVRDMNQLAKRLQKRRREQGQINLDLPDVDLVLDEEGRVVDAVPEDESFTHTLIEMFMVEANEAVARLLDTVDVPYLRRTHPEPELTDSDRLRQFVQVAGIRIPKQLDRKAIQALLHQVKGKPEAFAINLAVLKSLTRAEYSPEPIGHYALASEAYCHFTSPIRRYADLEIHRLLERYLHARDTAGGTGGRKKQKVKEAFAEAPTFDDLVELGRHISFTERRADDAERELRQIKILELLGEKLGSEYLGVVTGITNFGLFIQLQTYLIEGLIRYENLMDDWWDVEAQSGYVRGQRTGQKICIGDVVKIRIARTDVARRELDLAVTEVLGRRKMAALSKEALAQARDDGAEVAEPEATQTNGQPRPKHGHQKKGRQGKAQHPLQANRTAPRGGGRRGGRSGSGGGRRGRR